MALVRNGDAGDPLPNTRGGSRPPSLVACPSSGRDALAILDPPPNIRGGSRPRSSPKYSRWQSSPEPGRVSLVREGCAGDPNVCGSSPPKSRCVGPRQGRTLRRSSPKYLQCQLSPSQVACPSSGRDLSVVLPKILAVPVVPQVSTRGPRQGGGRRRISPKYMQWQPSPEPRRFSLVREGRSGDPPPKYSRWQSSPLVLQKYAVAVLPEASLRWPLAGRDAPAILPQIFAVAVVSEPGRMSLLSKGRADDSPSNIRGGSPPLSFVALALGREGRAGDHPRNLRGGSLLEPRECPSSGREAPVILPKLFAVAIIPQASSRGPRQGGTRRRTFPKCLRWQSSPSLVACPMSGRDAPAILPQIFAVAVAPAGPPKIRRCSRPPSLVAWPLSGRDAPAILPQVP